jgi:sugar lactone lactonase YvrE
MSSFQQIAKGLYLEGLSADAATGEVWYSDVIAGGLHRVAPDGTHTAFGDRMWTGGVMMNHDGKVLSSGAEGILWTDPKTGETGWLFDEIGVNEMVADASGGIFFGSIDLGAIIEGKTPGPASMYHKPVDGPAQLLAGDLGFINGVQLSQDGKRLFYNETFNATWAFDVAADGSLSNRTKLLDKPDCDGMAMDAAGNLWITGFESSHIVRLAPSGEELDPFPTPAGAITQIRFGADGHDFWICAVPADAGEKLKIGERPTAEESFVFKGRSDLAGQPMAPARFQLG